MHARKTPTIVVATETIALLRTHVAKGWSAKTEVKFEKEISAGHGVTARRRSQNVGSGGTSAMARLCLPEKAIERTQRTG